MTRRQRERAVRSFLYLSAALMVVMLVRVADWPLIRRNFFDVDIARTMWPDVLLIAARNTVLYTALAFTFGLALGLLLALMRLSSIGPYRWFATVYIEIFRGLPALLTIFLVGFGIPIAFQVRWPILLQITLGLGIVAAAYMAETIRAGIQGVPKGQMEAARSLGMSRTRAMVSITIPMTQLVAVLERRNARAR